MSGNKESLLQITHYIVTGTGLLDVTVATINKAKIWKVLYFHMFKNVKVCTYPNIYSVKSAKILLKSLVFG